MSDEQKPTVGQWILGQDSAITRHMQQIVTEKGLTLEDVVECTVRAFFYDGPPTKDGWSTYEATDLYCYRLSFKGRTPTHTQYWHRQRNGPLTYEQAKQTVEKKRLMYSDQIFLETFL